ncbi:hypothetical protein ACFYXM_12885 [Streptomyces sp. NPDC002476]|uniref:hypothetical protein n=1 Tax=Streptomyces sp. NPDC002476 TaxID=3364648 RepID=UPI00367930B8
MADSSLSRLHHPDASSACRQTMDASVERLRALPAEAREHDVLDEDVARLSPLEHANLNVLGCYTFRPSTPAGGGLRALRNPEAVGLDDKDGAEE